MKHETVERMGSYVIGGGGVATGVSWARFVELTDDLTIVIGFVTALMGCLIVALRLWRDWRRKPEKAGKRCDGE